MVHPLFGALTGAISLGIIIGGALFVYFQTREQQNHNNRHYTYTPPPDNSTCTGENTCAICLDSLDRTTRPKSSLTCGHTYHADCIKKWFDQSAKRCPMCRCYVN